ncbi:efflux transporter outer membrane subunit [Hymenobacter aquaticus]|uniref:Efflux transporter outer membrane subunit n=1 Tax=Hymenobacter aquaticus TaxID=1867101 RepID=A0A4Z0Q5B8_9BACT|nr:efflux transporter outer membrane subunit [Hymenobacter aquaticus]TGE25260.1 efflux transporter outer membrane subunit [Hymenobacter aquaticus]
MNLLQIPQRFAARWLPVLTAAALAVSSCQVTKPLPVPTAARVPATFTPGTTHPDTASIATLSWRRFFADPNLVGLLDTAVQANPDLQIALQRVEIARSGYVAARGALLPTASAVAAASVDRFADYSGTGFTDTNNGRQLPTPTPDYFLGLRSAWEIDVWGKLRSRRKAAYSRVLASEQGRRLVQTALVAQVAQLYYELLALDSELAVLGKNDTLQARALEIVRVQKLGGRATELAVQQFTAQLLRTRGLEVEARQRIVAAENQLNRLLGRYPRRIARGRPIREQQLPAAVAAGLPATMLLRRPDVQQAELKLLAARADVAAARAAFLPSLTLTPYVGLNAYRAALLFSTPGSLVFGALAGVAAPLLNRSPLKAEYGRAAAQQQAAFYGYQRAMQVGFEEVVTSLRGVENYRQLYGLQTQEVAALNRAVAISNDLYTANYATYIEVITAQRSALEAELKLTTTRREQFQRLIDLYRALGGGWDAAATAAN